MAKATGSLPKLLWQKKNPYNGIEITTEKIDKYFSPDYIELSNEEIEVIRSNSKFLSENPGENHMPKEEQYILKMYLLNVNYQSPKGNWLVTIQ